MTKAAITRPPTLPIELREITDYFAFTATRVTAWYLLDPIHWSMRSEDQQGQVIDSIASGLAGLVGHQVHLRVTSRPYRIAEWARGLAANTPAPLPGPAGLSWADQLADVQRHMARTTMSDKAVYLGVDIGSRGGFLRLLERMLSRTTATELDKLQRQTAKVDRAVISGGLRGHRATARDMEWLIHRSVGLYLPAPAYLSPVASGRWEAGDLDEFTDRVLITSRPGGRTVQLTHRPLRGAETTIHVAVLTFGRVDGIRVPDPGRAPWLSATDALGTVFERSSRFSVIGRQQTGKRFNRNVLRIRDQVGQYARHDVPMPPELVAKQARTNQILYEVAEGSDAEATRVVGQHRIAVWGSSEAEALEWASTLQEQYGPRGMTLRLPKAQLALVHEFVPGAPLATAASAYRRELPARYLAAGVPSAASKVGDDVGPYLGYTGSSARRAVHFDPHFATEARKTSGLVPVVGMQGAGKSALLGSIAYHAARRGEIVTILDPSGPLAALCRMPELAPYSRHVDLLKAPTGTLSPYAVVAEPPRWQEFLTDPDVIGVADPAERERLAQLKWNEARLEAAGERRELAEDVVKLLLPLRMVEHADTEPVLTKALGAVGGAPGRSLWHVVEQLREVGGTRAEHAETLADALAYAAEGLHGRLFFSDPKAPPLPQSVTDPTLLVITMQGIQLPDRDAPRSTWSNAERVAVPLLHLAAYYTTSRVYGRGRHVRKVVALDEVGLMAAWGSGNALFKRLGRDTRKWNIAAIVSSQDPADILGMNVDNHVSTMFVGRIESGEHIRAALGMLRLPVDVGFEAVVSGLSRVAGRGEQEHSPREFLMKDVDGQQDVVVVDLTATPALLAALNTNANPGRQLSRHGAPAALPQGVPA